MKKTLSLLAIFALALSIAACTKKKTDEVPPVDQAAPAAPAPAPEQAPEKK